MTPRRPEDTTPTDAAEEAWAIRIATRRAFDSRKRRHVLAWIDALLEQRRLTPDRGEPNRS